MQVEKGSASLDKLHHRTLLFLNGLLLLAMRGGGGEYAFNPPADTPVNGGARLIVMGDPASVAHLTVEAGAR